METITIEVEQEVAKAYRESDLNKQEKLTPLLSYFFNLNLLIKAFRK